MKKKWKTVLAAKLKSNAGESIGEVLVALLIAALALTMLASVIYTSSRMINESKTMLGEYYTANQDLEKRTGDDAKALTVTSVDGADSSTVYLLPKDLLPDASQTWLTVDCSTNDTIASRTVSAYRLVE